MLEKTNFKILHIGDIPFIKPWEEWYLKLAELYHCQFVFEIQNDFKLLSNGLKIGCLRTERENNEKTIFSEYDLIRIGREWVCDAFRLVVASTPLMTNLKVVDLFYKKNGNLWPHLNFKEGLHSAIIHSHPYLNTKGFGLIIGGSTEAIQAAFVLVELGIKHLTFVVETDKFNSTMMESAKNSLFQIKIEFITKEKIILLPGVYSVMICCEDLRNKQDLLTSLLYFNYLERGGLIINAVHSLDKVPLIEEASAIGAISRDVSTIQYHEAIAALKHLITISPI